MMKLTWGEDGKNVQGTVYVHVYKSNVTFHKKSTNSESNVIYYIYIFRHQKFNVKTMNTKREIHNIFLPCKSNSVKILYVMFSELCCTYVIKKNYFRSQNYAMK